MTSASDKKYERLRSLIEERIQGLGGNHGQPHSGYDHDRSVAQSELSDVLAAFDAGQPCAVSARVPPDELVTDEQIDALRSKYPQDHVATESVLDEPSAPSSEVRSPEQFQDWWRRRGDEVSGNTDKCGIAFAAWMAARDSDVSAIGASDLRQAALFRVIEEYGIRWSIDYPGSDPAQPYYIVMKKQGHGQTTCHGVTPGQAAQRALEWLARSDGATKP